VLYLGANHDAWAQASAMGLHGGNVAAFDKQAVGVSMAAMGARSKRYGGLRRTSQSNVTPCINSLLR
jgi:hypothetical protein